MLAALLAVAVLTLFAVVALLLRRPGAPPVTDPRLLQLVESLHPQLTRLEAGTEARLSALDSHLRANVLELGNELSALRRDAAGDAQAHRDAAARAASDLRDEINRILAHLGQTLTSHLADFRKHSADTLGAHRTDTTATSEQLRLALKQDLDAIHGRLAHFISEANRNHMESRDALHTRLTSLGSDQTAHQERLRATVEERLQALTTDNSAKLEQMRDTVGEKLHSTLHSRLTESFGQVTDQLSKVHTGLGEMAKLSEGVDDLSRIFTNVKSRGGFAEVQLGMLLEQMLAPSQFLRNARIKPNTQEVVEFAIRFPGHTGETLLPIDAKFPREDWERLEAAYEAGAAEPIAVAGRAFEAAIRVEGKRICDKYIVQPVTTPYAIMFLPTEGLYAEVMRRDGLQAELQSKCRVTIAGPSTLAAILSSFQMGFAMLAIQQKGGEVWTLLNKTKAEFGTFENLMTSMEKQVGTVQNTIQKIGVRTRAINKTLRDVGELDVVSGKLLSFDEAPGIAPLLAAVGDDEESPHASNDRPHPVHRAINSVTP